MQYRTMGKLGIKTSAFGLGCMRFNGVDIPGIFSVWNNVSLYDTDPKWDWGLRQIKEKGAGADKCVACGACEAACPQHLNIIESLQQAWKELNG